MTKIILFIISMSICLILKAQNGNELPFQKTALTPPMGWNSWDCFGPSVVESEVKANADYMAANLKSYGWEYIVVDIRWYIDNQTSGHYNAFENSDFIYDEYGRYLPSPTRFPSAANGKGFKPLADYVHNLGLKFGIHIMRGVPKIAVTEKLPIKGSDKTADNIFSTALECTWLKDNWTIEEGEGAQEYYNSIFELYALWGVDLVKVDDLSRPYHESEIEMIRNAIDNSGRPMVLSMSPGATPLEKHEHAKNNANMWRTIDDFWDNWSQLNYSFSKCAEWAPYISPGAWPDADMLPLGHLSIRGERGVDRMSNFTEDEQYTLMSLWSIFKSPLMFGGHLPDNDAFTNSLITNDEVLAMHKTSINNQEWFNNNGIGWVADDPMNGDKYLALFNNGGDGFVDTNQLIYRSGTISELTDGYGIDIDIEIPSGSNSLFLIVDDASDGFNYDHSNWINPTIYLDDNTTMLLTDLDWVYATSGWNSPQINSSISGGILNVKGTDYTKGIGTHSESIILYQIPENAVRFTAFAGLDIGGTSQPNSTPTVEFMVSTKNPSASEVNVNKSIASTGRISRTIQQEGKNITANITGASKLYLVATDAGDNFDYDHGDWINPTIFKDNGESLLLTSLDWVNATSGWDTVKKNTSLDGNPLKVNGTTYSNGFGFNSYSIIEFDLPAGYTRFESFCGFDDEVLTAPNGVSIEFMVFTEDPTNKSTISMPVDLEALGFTENCEIRDLWSKSDLGTYSGLDFAPDVVQHGAELYRISHLNRSNNDLITLSGPTQVNTGENIILNINVVTSTDTPSGWVTLYQDGLHIGTLEIDSSGNTQYNTSFSSDGNYSFVAKYSGNANYAPKTSDEMQINSTLSVKNIKKKNEPLIYNLDNLSYLKGITPGDEVEIFNIYGQKVVSFKAESNLVAINYFKGIAIIKVKTENNIFTIKTVL